MVTLPPEYYELKNAHNRMVCIEIAEILARIGYFWDDIEIINLSKEFYEHAKNNRS